MGGERPVLHGALTERDAGISRRGDRTRSSPTSRRATGDQGGGVQLVFNLRFGNERVNRGPGSSKAIVSGMGPVHVFQGGERYGPFKHAGIAMCSCPPLEGP